MRSISKLVVVVTGLTKTWCNCREWLCCDVFDVFKYPQLVRFIWGFIYFAVVCSLEHLQRNENCHGKTSSNISWWGRIGILPWPSITHGVPIFNVYNIVQFSKNEYVMTLDHFSWLMLLVVIVVWKHRANQRLLSSCGRRIRYSHITSI